MDRCRDLISGFQELPLVPRGFSPKIKFRSQCSSYLFCFMSLGILCSVCSTLLSLVSSLLLSFLLATLRQFHPFPKPKLLLFLLLLEVLPPLYPEGCKISRPQNCLDPVVDAAIVGASEFLRDAIYSLKLIEGSTPGVQVEDLRKLSVDLPFKPAA